jgi:hypothetical protein
MYIRCKECPKARVEEKEFRIIKRKIFVKKN